MALKRYKIDLYLSPDGMMPLNPKVPTLNVIHDLNFEHASGNLKASHQRYMSHYFPLFARNATRLATVSSYSKKDIAETYGAQADVDIEDICDPCTNPAETATEVVESARKLVSEENILTAIDKRFGSDNFADFMRKAPGTYVHVGSSDSDATRYPHHNEHFDLAEDSYPYAAALAVQYSLDYLK